MKVGFTGTREGMTPEQKGSFQKLIKDLGVTELHHGDCVGADSDAHDLSSVYIECHIHPCYFSHMRAYKETKPEFVYPIKPPLERNKDIVNFSDALIATPKESYQVLRSGTWSTIRYANAIGKQVYLIIPNGKVIILPKENNIMDFSK